MYSLGANGWKNITDGYFAGHGAGFRKDGKIMSLSFPVIEGLSGSSVKKTFHNGTKGRGNSTSEVGIRCDSLPMAHYLKAGIGTANFADDSSVVNVHAFPTLGVKLGMLLLNLGVWLYAAAAVAERVMPS
jgi:hypothetical protein